MCGIAGAIDLAGRRPVPPGVLQAMADAIFHRGPDEDGFLEQPGLGLASRRLSIVGLADGRQPITNEDRSVSVVFNGELFDYPEMRVELERLGHRFRTHCDTELIPHLWEDHQEGMFARLRGQFAIALWDQRRQCLILGRDRFGICPLYWSQQGDWLLFASEIKALLASGLIEARVDRRGINQAFTFFALPGPVTCFAGIQLLQPGHFLRIHPGQPGRDGPPALTVQDRTYWEIDYPDEGDEDPGRSAAALVDEFEAVLTRAVERRLRADVPVVSYLSGGVDSSMVVALANKVRGNPILTFTVGIQDPGLDERSEAAQVAAHVGSRSIVVPFGTPDVLATYPRLIQAAEGPVIDTACAALLRLAQEVHHQGYKVALTGEGADEWLAGYPWYKTARLLGMLDVVPGIHLSQLARRAYLRLIGMPLWPRAAVRRSQEAIGGHNAWLDIFGLMSVSKLLFYSPEMRDELADHQPFEDLGLNLNRMRCWHPLNRALCLGARVMLPGLLLLSKGDRVAMHSSVETRYPFLDEDVFAFLARLAPRWKLRRLRDKYLLRLLAKRWLPAPVAERRKVMFRAPTEGFHASGMPPYVDQLLSEESLRKAGYFDPKMVHYWRARLNSVRAAAVRYLPAEMGMVGVVATQLWHHLFIDPSLADLPGRTDAARVALSR